MENIDRIQYFLNLFSNREAFNVFEETRKKIFIEIIEKILKKSTGFFLKIILANL